MKIFVSTTKTQGQRNDDFCFVPEGEIVTFGVLLCSDPVKADQCGCNRSLCGIVSDAATTTMKVIDYACSLFDLQCLFNEALERGGWTQAPFITLQPMAAKLVEAASRFNVRAI